MYGKWKKQPDWAQLRPQEEQNVVSEERVQDSEDSSEWETQGKKSTKVKQKSKFVCLYHVAVQSSVLYEKRNFKPHTAELQQG